MRDCILIINRGAVNCRLRNDFKGRGLQMGVFVGGGGGGVDLDLDFKNFWDGVYNFFFCPPLVLYNNYVAPISISWFIEPTRY